MFSSGVTPISGEARLHAETPSFDAVNGSWSDEFPDRDGWFDADTDPVAAGRDGLDAVVDVSTLMSVFAAQRFERVESLRREAVAEAAVFRGRTTEIVMRSLRLELAAVLQVTEHAAERMLTTAEGLVNRYPTMLDALSHARTTETHADVFVELVDTVEPELRDQVVPLAVDLATAHPLGSFRRLLRKLVDTVRAATLGERHAVAVRERRVVVQPAEDGMSWVLLYTSAVTAHAIHHRATAIAKVLADQDGEERSLDELRANVMVDLLIDGDTPTHPTRPGGSARESPSPSRCCRCSMTNPRGRSLRWWRASGRSPSTRPGSCVVGRRGGCGCSPTPRPGWSSRWGGSSTAPPPRCGNWWSGGRRPAWDRAAEHPRTAAR